MQLGPIRFLRTFHQVPTKSRKLPSVAFDNAKLDWSEPDHLNRWLASEKWHHELPAPPSPSSEDAVCIASCVRPPKRGVLTAVGCAELSACENADAADR